MFTFGFSQIQLHTKLTPVNITPSAAASDIEMPLEGPSNQTPELPEIASGVQRTDLHSTNTTLYFCPLTACRFKTTKEGIKKGEAVRHLNDEHRITGALMKNSPPGTYKFSKLVVLEKHLFLQRVISENSFSKEELGTTESINIFVRILKICRNTLSVLKRKLKKI